VLSELANALAWRGDTDTSAADLRLDLGRQPTVDELIEAIPALDKWAAPIAAHWPSETGDDTLPPHDPAAVPEFSNTTEETGTVPYHPMIRGVQRRRSASNPTTSNSRSPDVTTR